MSAVIHLDKEEYGHEEIRHEWTEDRVSNRAALSADVRIADGDDRGKRGDAGGDKYHLGEGS